MAEPDIVVPSPEELKDLKHLQSVRQHIANVQAGCNIIADQLLERGQSDFARMLIQRGMTHDLTKFKGIEWLHLRVGQEKTELFKLALEQHQLTNDHHPEYWGDIKAMPALSVAEMVCDWRARSTEFGTDLREWIKESACRKYEITTKTNIYKTIKDFVDLLLDNPFK